MASFPFFFLSLFFFFFLFHFCFFSSSSPFPLFQVHEILISVRMREETTVDTRRVASGDRWESSRGTTKQLRDIRGKRQHDEREPRSKESPHAQLVGVARANVPVVFGHSSCSRWPAPRIPVAGKRQRCAHPIAAPPAPSSTLPGPTGTTTECRSVPATAVCLFSPSLRFLAKNSLLLFARESESQPEIEEMERGEGARERTGKREGQGVGLF